MTVILLSAAGIILLAGLLVLLLRLRKAAQTRQELVQQHEQQLARYQVIVDVEAERVRIKEETQAEKEQVFGELAAGRQRAEAEQVRIQAEIQAEQEAALGQLAAARQQAEVEQARIQAETQAEKEAVLTQLVAARQQAEAEQQRLTQTIDGQRTEIVTLEQRITELQTELQALDEQTDLQSLGFYSPRYSFDLSTSYQLEQVHVRDQQKRMITTKTAATCTADWTVNGSIIEGRKQTNQTLKLMLRAFNGECDAAVAKVKYNNVSVMETRIRKAYEAVNSLVVVQQATLSADYLDLKLKELYLAHEYQEKLQAEKEEQRQIREQMREEELAQREIEKARLDAEKEEKRFADALRKAQEEVANANGAKQARLLAEIEQLQLKLAQASTNKERAISRAQFTRSGHVYVISNVGSFGEEVYKIGMTRRLEPMDRVRELGDASVPFQFDVHAIIYCDDAPSLESTLHRTFHARRVNQVNYRKEFFRVSLAEIADAVRQHHAEIEFTLAAEAVEYRKTVALLQSELPN